MLTASNDLKQKDQIENLKETKPLKGSFTFRKVENGSIKGFDDKFVKEMLDKWGLLENCYVCKFSFDQEYSDYKASQFLQEFFASPEVNPFIRVKSSGDRWGSLGPVSQVKAERLACENAFTDLKMLDKLAEFNIVRDTGDIVKCFDEYSPDGFTVSDNLRKAILLPEFEEYSAFSQSDRSQLLFRLLRAFVLGGKICQYEDTIDNYVAVLKPLYKLFTSVKTDSAHNLKISSFHYSILDVECKNSPLFPALNIQNFCYVNILPETRNVLLFYHASDIYYQ